MFRSRARCSLRRFEMEVFQRPACCTGILASVLAALTLPQALRPPRRRRQWRRPCMRASQSRSRPRHHRLTACAGHVRQPPPADSARASHANGQVARAQPPLARRAPRGATRRATLKRRQRRMGAGPAWRPRRGTKLPCMPASSKLQRRHP